MAKCAGRSLVDILEEDYDFQCDGGPLKGCAVWKELKRKYRLLREREDVRRHREEEARALAAATPVTGDLSGFHLEGLLELIGDYQLVQDGKKRMCDTTPEWQELKKQIQVMRERWEEREEATVTADEAARIAGQTIMAAYARDRDKSVLPDTYGLEVLIRKIEALYTGEVNPLRWNDYWRVLKLRMRKWQQEENTEQNKEERERATETIQAARLSAAARARSEQRDKSVLPGGYTLEGLLGTIASCGYTCEAGPLEHNSCWEELKRRAQRWQERIASNEDRMFGSSMMEKGAQMFHDVLQRVCTQVFSGKGEKRHGLGRSLLEQPAFLIRKVSDGYFVGQALKKIMEAQEAPLDFEGRVQELLDAVAYLVFEMMYMDL